MSVFRELSSTITLTLTAQVVVDHDEIRPSTWQNSPLDAGLELGVTTDRSKMQCHDPGVNPRTYYLGVAIIWRENNFSSSSRHFNTTFPPFLKPSASTTHHPPLNHTLTDRRDGRRSTATVMVMDDRWTWRWRWCQYLNIIIEFDDTRS